MNRATNLASLAAASYWTEPMTIERLEEIIAVGLPLQEGQLLLVAASGDTQIDADEKWKEPEEGDFFQLICPYGGWTREALMADLAEWIVSLSGEAK